MKNHWNSAKRRLSRQVPSTESHLNIPGLGTAVGQSGGVPGVALTLSSHSAHAPSDGAAAETVDLESVGYMALKKLVIAHGVPKAEASQRPTKAGLKELAQKHGANITFT